jgi:anti-sigma-K factor RskA
VLVIMSKRPQKLPEDDRILAAEYALGVLQGEERTAFEKRIENEPSMAAAVREWDEDFISMSDSIPSVAPPRRLETELERRLFGEAAKPSLWSSLSFWRGLAVASLAAVVALGAYNLRPVSPGAPSLVAEVAGETKAVRLVALYDQDKGELRLNRVEGTAASGRSFELWLIAGNDAPVSLGVLPADQTKTFAVPANLRSKFKDGVLAISDEPTGGSTTGAPTGAVLATGKLTVI